MEIKDVAKQIFLAGVESVLPEQMIRRQVFIKNNILHFSGTGFSLDSLNNVYVIGAGKASANMAAEIERILSERITGGHIITKYGNGCTLKYIQVTEAGHPTPDNNGYAATREILEIANRANENDLVICLISGGGSALLADFPEGGTPDNMILINNLLLKSGADIREMNTVRKHLSKVKGGQLATVIYPAILVTLILSDVIGDILDSIASGPTVPDPSTFGDALRILEKYELTEKIPRPLLSYLEKGSEGLYPETPKPGDPKFRNTYNIVIGSNKIALEASRYHAVKMGFHTIIITSELDGDVIKMAEQIIETAIRFQNDFTIPKPCCLLLGGETTIRVTGPGTGGRNQHLALYSAMLLKDKKGITLLSAGTDGTDGPTSAAGAVVDSKSADEAMLIGLYAKKYLNEFDSFHFFEKAGGLIITGPTMTNVMDIVVILIEQ